MKYFFSYKQTWNDLVKLRQNLEIISQIFTDKWDETFIFFRDLENWWEKGTPVNEVLKLAFSEIDKSDCIFAFIDNESKSEWMLLELGYAKSKWKKIILAIKSDLWFLLVREIADSIIEFIDFDDLIKKLDNSYF